MTQNIKGGFLDTIERGASKLSSSHVAKKIRGPYRSPSLKTRLGVTKLKKNFRKATGLNAIARWSPSRVGQRIKQKYGWYSDSMKDLRATLSFNRFNPFNRIPKL
jgi:hypothetical protein